MSDTEDTEPYRKTHRGGKECKRQGLTPYLLRIGTHTLRKTWGYQARKAGEPIEIIQAKLGHANASITRHYIGITADEIEGIEDRVVL